MSWVAVGVTVGGAVLGNVQANEQQRAQKQHNQAAAEHNRYSNWTGRQMQQRFGAPSSMSGTLQGGLAGFGAARGFMGGGGEGGAAPDAGGGGMGVAGNSFAGASTKTGLGAKDPYQNMLKRGQDPRTRTFFD